MEATILKHFPKGMILPLGLKVIKRSPLGKILRGTVHSNLESTDKTSIFWGPPEDGHEGSYHKIEIVNELAPEDYKGFVSTITKRIPPHSFNDNTFILCKTESQAAELCYLLDYYGRSWHNGSSYLDNTNWEENLYLTCYNTALGIYGGYLNYKHSGSIIIEYKDLK
jgi:hypothetical protein